MDIEKEDVHAKRMKEMEKNISVFIKADGRERVLAEIEECVSLQEERIRLAVYCEKVRDILLGNPYMARTAGIGYQKMDEIMDEKIFYVDKTQFIKEWWESRCQVSLITRPRRFGKTLMLSTVNCFFSTLYVTRKDIFEGLKIWQYEEYRNMQGTFPVIFMTFAAVKAPDFSGAIHTIGRYFQDLYATHGYILNTEVLSDEDKCIYKEYREKLGKADVRYCKSAMAVLSYLLFRYYGKKVIILLDEYDTLLQESYLNGYWEIMSGFMKCCMNETFKSNAYLDRALMTGITNIPKESMFSDVNNIVTYTITSKKYADSFGFTEKEVFDCLICQDVAERQMVKEWYDGFTFGGIRDIYNPWSIISYIENRQFKPCWVNSGGYGFISRLFLRSKSKNKQDLQLLLEGKSIHKIIDENLTYPELDHNSEAIWSFLVTTGYLRTDNVKIYGEIEADLTITNHETMIMFQKMVKDWFGTVKDEYNAFCNALIQGDIEGMNEYMNYVAMEMISVFDVGRRPSEKAPERFYHGFVLGLVVALREEYEITSNRESGFGRYDIMMRPKKEGFDGIIIEFKVRDEKKEETLNDTVRSALDQIAGKGYERELLKNGLTSERIHAYGFAFEGKEVLIGAKRQSML